VERPVLLEAIEHLPQARRATPAGEVVIQPLEDLVDALADERLDRLRLGGDPLDVAVLELPRAVLERGELRVAVGSQRRGFRGVGRGVRAV
jgi:hypothetical protein